jgi:hypothetical protein
MLGLAQEVGGNDLRVGRVVGQDHHLRRPGQQVDPDRAEQLALGLGHVGVTGADEHVDGLEPLDPERHRGEGLDAADAEDLSSAPDVAIAYSCGGCMPRASRGGAHPTIRPTPATRGTATVMIDDAIRGYRPPGE